MRFTQMEFILLAVSLIAACLCMALAGRGESYLLKIPLWITAAILFLPFLSLSLIAVTSRRDRNKSDPRGDE